MPANKEQKKKEDAFFSFLIYYFKTRYKFSPVVAEALAEDILRLFYIFNPNSIKVGQILTLAVSNTEPPGKSLNNCQFVPVKLTLHASDDTQCLKNKGLKELKLRVIRRITQEAFAQGGSLSQNDIATLLFVDRRTVVDYIKELESRGITVITRAKFLSQGKQLPEKQRVIRMFLEGFHQEEGIARETHYSIEYVKRHINNFLRTSLFYRQGITPSNIVKITGMTLTLVNEYIEIYEALTKEIKIANNLYRILSLFESPSIIQILKNS